MKSQPRDYGQNVNLLIVSRGLGIVGTAAVPMLAADPRSRQRLDDAAAQRVAEGFTVDHMARAYEKLHLDVLPPWRKPVSHATP